MEVERGRRFQDQTQLLYQLITSGRTNLEHLDRLFTGGQNDQTRAYALAGAFIRDLAQEHGISMAMHMAGTPVSTMASVHCAAATENFLTLENHSVDVPWWGDLVDGIEKPIINKGYITVPDKPGLGVTLNEEIVKQHLLEPGYFEPTPQWNTDRSSDRQWS